MMLPIPANQGWTLIKQFPLVRGGAVASTTSTTGADVVVLRNLRIPMDRSFILAGTCRKTAGAAAAGNIGLKINATQVARDSGGAADNLCIWSSRAGNEIATGSFFHFYGARDNANFLKNGLGVHTSYEATGIASDDLPCWNNAQPQAIITSITLTGRVGNAAVTLEIHTVELWMSGLNTSGGKPVPGEL